MEASSAQPYKEKEQRIRRPCAFDKMEGLVREMQDPDNGVPVRSQKVFLTSIPSAFMGYDLIEWLMERLNIEESEAVHIANQLCQYGYFFPVNDSRTLTVKDDSSLYRFQTPYYWPWQHRQPDNVEYAIYLSKRTLRNKQRHGLEDYEIAALNELKKNLQNKWDIIQLQAEEQVKIAKDRKKGDKIVCDSQERAFWRVCRPPPNCPSSFDVLPLPSRAWPGLPRPPPRKRTLNDVQREVELLRNSLTRTRVKFSVAVENLKTYFQTFVEHDPMITQPQPSNPWITDDATFWQLNSPVVEVPTEKRVKRWKISMEELMSDPTGLQEFTNYLKKEYCLENIRFWLAVKELRHTSQAKINEKVQEIFEEFLVAGAVSEINIDSKAKEKVHQAMKNPNRFIFDSAAEHVYTMLLKKDCYPRFIRSDHYQSLLAAGVQPLQKKRFFNFGGQGKKKLPSGGPTAATSLSQQQHPQLPQQHSIAVGIGPSGRRRGSDRSLSGSAHELALCGVRDSVVAAASRVPHSHSQSNLTDIPYREAAGVPEPTTRPMDDVCPWEAAPTSGRTPSIEATCIGEAGTSLSSSTLLNQVAPISSSSTLTRASRKDSQSQLDSCSSSSDVSVAVIDTSERLRRTSSVAPATEVIHHHHHPHHHPHHHHHHPHQHQPSAQMQRNYSVGSSASQTRVKLAETTRASVSTCNFPSPQHSFDLSYSQRQQLHHQAVSVAELPMPSPVEPVPEEVITEPPERLERLDSMALQSSSRSTKAPLISISAIVGELPEELPATDDDTITDTPDTSSDCALMSEPLTQTQSMAEEAPAATAASSSSEQQQQPSSVAPKSAEQSESVAGNEAVAPTDTSKSTEPLEELAAQQQDKAEPAAATASKEQRDNNVNEVCPWEDEENCRVDAPYVKTYATLGYL